MVKFARWLFDVLRNIVIPLDTDWELTNRSQSVTDIFGRERIGLLMSRRRQGAVEYRLPTDAEMQQAADEQSYRP